MSVNKLLVDEKIGDKYYENGDLLDHILNNWNDDSKENEVLMLCLTLLKLRYADREKIDELQDQNIDLQAQIDALTLRVEALEKLKSLL